MASSSAASHVASSATRLGVGASDVGGDAERVVLGSDAERDLRRVVRDVLGGHLQAPDVEAPAHHVLAHLEARADARREDARVEVDGAADGARDLLDAAEVIAVMMRRNDGVEAELAEGSARFARVARVIGAAAIERDAECGETRLERARSEAGVDEDADPLRLDEQGIPARPGAEDEGAKRVRHAKPS